MLSVTQLFLICILTRNSQLGPKSRMIEKMINGFQGKSCVIWRAFIWLILMRKRSKSSIVCLQETGKLFLCVVTRCGLID